MAFKGIRSPPFSLARELGAVALALAAQGVAEAAPAAIQELRWKQPHLPELRPLCRAAQRWLLRYLIDNALPRTRSAAFTCPPCQFHKRFQQRVRAFDLAAPALCTWPRESLPTFILHDLLFWCLGGSGQKNFIRRFFRAVLILLSGQYQ